MSESFTSNDQDTTSHSIFNATPVTVKSGQMNQTLHPVSKKQGYISFCMSSDYLICIATLVLSLHYLYYTDKNKNREIDPFLIPVKTNSITLEYAKENGNMQHSLTACCQRQILQPRM